MKKWIYETPLEVAAFALYPAHKSIKQAFVRQSNFGDPIQLYREMVGKDGREYVALPRNLCPIPENNKMSDGKMVDFISAFQPRSQAQADLINESVLRLKARESFVIQAKTGFGKTWCSMDIIASIKRKTLVVVTKEDVRDQWIEAAKKVLGLQDNEIGIIQGTKRPGPNAKLTIGMIQTLSKPGKFKPGQFREYGLIIWDEVHRVGADQFSNTGFLFPSQRRVGLSATPTRKDGKDILILAHIGPVKVETGQGTLVPRVVQVMCPFFFPANMPASIGKTVFLNKYIAKIDRRNREIIKIVLAARKKGRSILIFSEYLAHLDELSGMFLASGGVSNDSAKYVGGLTKAQREAYKKKPVLFTTYKYTAEATDIPWADTAILTMPRSDVVQIVGRILRVHPGKQEPVVFDFVDTQHDILFKYYKSRMKFYQKVASKIDVVQIKA